MWSYDLKRRLFLMAVLGLAACGFEPLLKQSDGALFGQVSVQEPTSALEFDLYEALRARIGTSAAPRWHLTYQLETEQVRMGITDANRGRLIGRLTYRLAGTGDEIAGKVEAFAGFTIAETTPTDTAPIVSNRIARRDAERRLAGTLTDRLVAELRLSLSRAEK